MPVQPSFSPSRPVRVRVRSVRRPFAPSQDHGSYRLPHDAAERLAAALAGFRNRDAAFALAVFLARYWSSRARLARPFPIDRRALAGRADLGLTEARIRGAIGTLEAVGFLNRGLAPPGSAYKATPDGLHRKPILWGFGPEFGPLFAAANARAQAARDRRQLGRGSVSRGAPERPPAELLVASPRSPKHKSEAFPVVLMGQVKRGCREQRAAPSAAPHSALESALHRWREAAGFALRVEG